MRRRVKVQEDRNQDGSENLGGHKPEWELSLGGHKDRS